MDKMKKWLIWSIEHNAWWMPHHFGYTNNRAEAGRYTLDEAKEICRQEKTRRMRR
jgi:hypothetical protein